MYDYTLLYIIVLNWSTNSKPINLYREVHDEKTALCSLFAYTDTNYFPFE